MTAEEFLLAYLQAELLENEAELKRLETINFASSEAIAAMKKWTADARKIIKEMSEPSDH